MSEALISLLSAIDGCAARAPFTAAAFSNNNNNNNNNNNIYTIKTLPTTTKQQQQQQHLHNQNIANNHKTTTTTTTFTPSKHCQQPQNNNNTVYHGLSHKRCVPELRTVVALHFHAVERLPKIIGRSLSAIDVNVCVLFRTIDANQQRTSVF
jgi:hypothetical protein